MSTETTNTPPQNQQITVGLALVGGFGITLIVVAFFAGVVDSTINSSVIGLAILAGLLALFGAIVAWFAVVQPHKHFDDINVPQYHGHEHHDDHHEDESETAAG